MRHSDVFGMRCEYARLKQIHQSLKSSSCHIGFASSCSFTRIQLHLPHERRSCRVEATTVSAKSQNIILGLGTPRMLSLSKFFFSANVRDKASYGLVFEGLLRSSINFLRQKLQNKSKFGWLTLSMKGSKAAQK